MHLVAVQGSIRLAEPAASLWAAMVATCRDETGVALRITSPFGGHRTEADTEYMWRHKSTSTTGVVARPKSLGGGGSVHENGLSVDISNWSDAAAWLTAHARRFGAVRTIANEPWHFEFRLTPQHTLTTTLSTQEDAMNPRPPFFRKTAGPIQNSVYLVILDPTQQPMPALEIDGRTEAGVNEITSFQNQQAQQFDKGGVGLPYLPMVLTPANYDALKSRCSILTAPIPAFKS